MADNQKTFLLRVVSALSAALLLLACGYYGGPQGLIALSLVAISIGIWEYSKVAFHRWQMPRALEYLYWILCAGMLWSFFTVYSMALISFTLGVLIFFTSALWLTRGRVTNENLMSSIAMACFGFLYCVVFPFFALKLIQLENGPQWFLLLLLVVFFGDSFAYFGGRWFGRHKMMPAISPNKTWEGSLSGILGSCLAGMIHLFTAFDELSATLPLWQGLIFCIAGAFVAQSGDLLASLVKRVAQIKDSGQIMPGHGGILDRLDGVYMASPLFYAFALYVTHQF